MKKKVVAIAGSGHCGSTMLTLMLGSHPDCFSLGELNSLPTHYKTGIPICGVCQGRCSFWDEFDPDKLKLLAAVLGNTRLNKYVPLKLEKTWRTLLRKDDVFNAYSYLFSQREESILIDSSKAINWISEKLNTKEFTSGLVEGYLVHLVRDGRAVLNSYLRRFKWMTAEKYAREWRKKTILRNQLYEQFPSERKIIVRYEHLATEPQKTLETVCEWLGIEFVPQMISYWQFDHHVISGNAGVRSLIWRYKQEEIQEDVSKYHGEHYDNLGLKIKLDNRWKEELSAEKLETFNWIAGDINKPYEWEIDEANNC